SLAYFGKYARVAMSTFVEWLEDSARAGEAIVPDAPLPPEKKQLLALPKAALAALAGMGEGAKPALPALVHLATSPLPDNDSEIRTLLGAVLKIIGPDAVPSLTAELKNPVADTRARAARAIASMGLVAATAVPDLIELSKSAVDSDAQSGSAGLQAVGPVAYELAAPYLVKVLREDLFADRRKWAAWALGDIRVPADGDRHKVIDALLLALLDPDEAVCRGAHGALARVGAPALPRLREMLKLGEGEAPYWAVRVLARMKADPADVIPRLAELTLPGKRPVERGTAADLLGEYAPAHPEIIPPLLRLLGDREDYVARAAVRSLTPFGAKVVEPLGKLLAQRNPLVRRRALEALEVVRAALEQKDQPM
ncbi:MAG: HEAT repeat domain-containing protein, partial [Planctomycetota bacterium]|nr:HEAT repeat domain-containing protein [Planctomycetota bacterium]